MRPAILIRVYSCGQAGGVKPGRKPSAAGKVALVGFVPVATQRSSAPSAVRSWGPVKLQWPFPLVNACASSSLRPAAATVAA